MLDRLACHEDHPRLCGEKKWFMTKKTFMARSPPPMRGKDTELVGMLAGGGITPAYAGKSYPSPAYYNTHKDHPRLCGEKNDFSGNDILGIGSPPPMRGKVSTSAKHTLSTGITPAYAGKSDFHDAHLRFFEDHPRLCGEKFRMIGQNARKQGSPPPMRGKGIKRL